jgi:hypothetical protein
MTLGADLDERIPIHPMLLQIKEVINTSVNKGVTIAIGPLHIRRLTPVGDIHSNQK